MPPREGYTAAELLADTTEEQRRTTLTALDAARLEGRTEGWHAAAKFLDRAAPRMSEAPELQAGMEASAMLLRKYVPPVREAPRGR